MSDINPQTAIKQAVLIVDDNPDIVFLLSKLLQTEGYITATAISGYEAIDYLDNNEPEMVLLDYMMPDITGLEILKKIKRVYPLSQVIIITGRGDEKIATAFMKAGATDYISKPFDNQQILNSLENAYTKRVQEQKRLASQIKKDKAQLHLRREKKQLTAALKGKNRDLEKANIELRRINESLKEKNEDISRLEKMYQEIFDKAGDGIIKMNLEGKILMANMMAASILGKNRLERKMFSDFLNRDSKEKMATLLSSLSTGRVTLEEMEVEIPGQDGQRTLNIRAVPLRKGGKVKELEILMTDITEKIHQQKVVKKLEERAIIAGLSRHLSHVLLNALTSAGGYLQKVGKSVRPAGDTKHYFNVINSEMARMEDVVRGYQDYVRITNLVPSSLQHIDTLLKNFPVLLKGGVDSEIDRIIKPINKQFKLKEVRLESGGATVLIDPYYMNLGLVYLIKGLVFYSLKSGDSTVSLALRSMITNRKITISIITLDVFTPEKVVASMYSPWEHQMLHQTFEDWGISIANSIAERHQGKLEVSDTPEGTRYDILLPAAS